LFVSYKEINLLSQMGQQACGCKSKSLIQSQNTIEDAANPIDVKFVNKGKLYEDNNDF
jgi:hypothetical protein